jgi:hypothetical protein
VKITDHSGQREKRDDEILHPGRDHHRFAVAAYGEDEKQPGEDGDSLVADQRVDKEIDKERVEAVQQYVEEEIPRCFEEETFEQKIMDAVNKRLELEWRTALECGGTVGVHHDAVLKADVVVAVPESVVQAEPEEQKAQDEESGEDEKVFEILQKTPPERYDAIMKL